jgi:hypothetical protein
MASSRTLIPLASLFIGVSSSPISIVFGPDERAIASFVKYIRRRVAVETDSLVLDLMRCEDELNCIRSIVQALREEFGKYEKSENAADLRKVAVELMGIISGSVSIRTEPELTRLAAELESAVGELSDALGGAAVPPQRVRSATGAVIATADTTDELLPRIQHPPITRRKSSIQSLTEIIADALEYRSQ